MQKDSAGLASTFHTFDYFTSGIIPLTRRKAKERGVPTTHLEAIARRRM